MGVAENIDALLVKFDITAESLARIAGVQPPTVSRWRHGATPREEPIKKMAEYFDLERDDIVSDAFGLAAKEHGHIGYTHEISYSVTTLTAPVYGRIAAGDALEMLRVEDEAYVIPSVAALHPDGFFLTLSGDSMDKIMPGGSLVYIDREVEVRSGDVAVVVVNGDDATIKRVFFAGDTLVLHPESNNPAHRDRSIDASDPDAPRVRMLGKAVWHYQVNDNRL